MSHLSAFLFNIIAKDTHFCYFRNMHPERCPKQHPKNTPLLLFTPPQGTSFTQLNLRHFPSSILSVLYRPVYKMSIHFRRIHKTHKRVCLFSAYPLNFPHCSKHFPAVAAFLLYLCTFYFLTEQLLG